MTGRNRKLGATKPHSKDLTKFDVSLAVNAVNDSGRPLDLDVGNVDLSPTALDLPSTQDEVVCPHRRYICSVCGTPLR